MHCFCDIFCMLCFARHIQEQTYSPVCFVLPLLRLLSSVFVFILMLKSHGRWHIANRLLMSSTLLRLIALLFAVKARASCMESISLAHVNSASSTASLQASGTYQALQLAHVPGTSAHECFVSCCASQWRGKLTLTHVTGVPCAACSASVTCCLCRPGASGVGGFR